MLKFPKKSTREFLPIKPELSQSSGINFAHKYINNDNILEDKPVKYYNLTKEVLENKYELEVFVHDFCDSQKELDDEYQKILDEYLWELV